MIGRASLALFFLRPPFRWDRKSGIESAYGQVIN